MAKPTTISSTRTPNKLKQNKSRDSFLVVRQASNEPVAPRDTVDPLFRPVNFLVPFTPQQGEISGACAETTKSARPA